MMRGRDVLKLFASGLAVYLVSCQCYVPFRPLAYKSGLYIRAVDFRNPGDLVVTIEIASRYGTVDLCGNGVQIVSGIRSAVLGDATESMRPGDLMRVHLGTASCSYPVPAHSIPLGGVVRVPCKNAMAPTPDPLPTATPGPPPFPPCATCSPEASPSISPTTPFATAAYEVCPTWSASGSAPPAISPVAGDVGLVSAPPSYVRVTDFVQWGARSPNEAAAARDNVWREGDTATPSGPVLSVIEPGRSGAGNWR